MLVNNKDNGIPPFSSQILFYLHDNLNRLSNGKGYTSPLKLKNINFMAISGIGQTEQSKVLAMIGLKIINESFDIGYLG